MFQYRQVLVRLCRGKSDREIGRSKYIGRRKLAALREVAARKGWLDPAAPLPEDAAIAAALGGARRSRHFAVGRLSAQAPKPDPPRRRKEVLR